MKIDSSPSSTLDCDQNIMKVKKHGNIIYQQFPQHRKFENNPDGDFKTRIDDTCTSNRRTDDTPTSGPPFSTESSMDYRIGFSFESNHEMKNKDLKFNEELLDMRSTIYSVDPSLPAPSLLTSPSSSLLTPPSSLLLTPPSSFFSSSLPSTNFLLSSRSTAISLPPSPLLPPIDCPATSSSLSSLLERRRSRQGQKNKCPLSLYDSTNKSKQIVDSTCKQSSLKYESNNSTTVVTVTPISSPSSSSKIDDVTNTSTIQAVQFPVKVLSDLFLGNSQTSSDLNCLQKHNIGYIVNVTSDVINSFEHLPDFRYLRIPITDDSWSQDMDRHFQLAIDFIDEGRRNKRSILIHCMAGVSRSVSITVAYLMKSERLTMDDAYDLLKGCKSNINPNLSLMGQLQLFGEKLRNEETKSKEAKPSSLDMSNLSINKKKSIHSVLITPETATDRSSDETGSHVFCLPCTPPATPNSKKCFGPFKNRGMSLHEDSKFGDV